MQTIARFLTRNIGYVALVLGLYGLIPAVILFFSPEKQITGLWSIFIPIGINPQLLTRYTGISWNFLGVIFYLMMVVGAGRYLQNKFDVSGLLRFCFSAIFYGSIMRIFWTLLLPVIFMRTTKDSGAPYHWISLIWVLYPVFLLWVSKIAVKGMDDELKATEEKIFSDPVENILKFETGKNGRFIHLIVDLILTISLLMPFLFVFQYFIPGSDMIRTSKFLFITLLFFQRFIYYGVLESVFKATPAKYLTGSKVVNQHGATNPGFEKIIMRSLFRFIPFEPFSFLGTTGWHDGLSCT
ncbi:MAG: RDD family protein, partial [Saprospiraceae bacterium]